MGWLKKALGVAVNVAVPVAIGIVAPGSVINTTVGLLVKHKTKINNQNIPALNFVLSSVVAYGRKLATGEDPVASILPSLGEGAILMSGSTALHQSIKVPVKRATGRSF